MGINEFKNEQMTGVTSLTEKSDCVFSQSFESGSFYILEGFCQTRNLTFADRDATVAYIKETMGFDCGIGECGNFGVFVPQLPVGAAYQYKRVVDHSSEHKRQQVHANDEDARA